MKRILIAALALSLFLPAVSQAEDINEIFKKVNEYVESKNYTKALEELNWAKKEIEKLRNEGIKTYFPDQVEGLTGQKFDVSSALGMTNLERRYAGGSTSVVVSLVGGGKTGAFGGLAGLGKMAAMMQQGQGIDSFRIDGLTASLDESGTNPELSVFLDSGSILKIEGTRGADGEKLKSIAKEIDLGGLDTYLKGAAAAKAQG